MAHSTWRPLAWWLRNVRAIDEEPALRAYGAILSCAMALNAFTWFTYKNVAQIASEPDGICWPTLPNCMAIRSHLGPEAVRDAVLAHIAFSLAAAVSFWRRGRHALTVFVLGLVPAVGVYALDFRLHSNETYMLSWCVAVFLVAPRKSAALQALVALFYFWAGTLKLNADWISGAALYAPPFLIPAALIPAACVYVLVLELVLIWGLFARSSAVRWSVYAQLLLFHVLSWNVVGYHYPLVMLGLTSIYPLVWRLMPGSVLTRATIRSDPGARWSVAGAAALFSSFQMVPRLQRGDSAVTGEGRYFALHMFDALVECEGGATVRSRSGQVAHVDIIDVDAPPRIRCDPIALLASTRHLCRKAESWREPVTIDVAVDAKRVTGPAMRPLVHLEDVCNKPVEYSAWHHNDWITP